MEITGSGQEANDAERDQPDQDVQAMEAGQGEESRRKQVGADGDAVGVEPRVLGDLANQEHSAQADARQPPGGKTTLIVSGKAALGQIHGAAAGEQEQAK